jgi:Protein of unknown function, DUF488
MTPPIFTSRWSSPLLRDVDAQIIGVSRGVPRWPLPYTYRMARWLAPDGQTWALRGDQEGFRASYERQLEAIGAQEIIARITEMTGGRPAVLLCSEKVPEKPCHRRYLSEWIETRTGIVIPELSAGDLPESHSQSPRLF